MFAATPHHEKTHIGRVEDNSNLLTQTLKALKSFDFKAFFLYNENTARKNAPQVERMIFSSFRDLHTIAYVTNRLNHRAIAPKLLPEGADVHIDRPRFAVVIHLPDIR